MLSRMYTEIINTYRNVAYILFVYDKEDKLMGDVEAKEKEIGRRGSGGSEMEVGMNGVG